MKILIIIPAYNEELNIERVVDNLIENYPQYDYVVVNDGSRDKTADICRERGYNLLDLPVNMGLSEAIQTGVRYALKEDYDAVIQFDGDGQHRPEYIKPLMQEIEKNQADIVIGSRFLTEKKPITFRMLGSSVLTFIIKMSTGYILKDPTSGMRMFGKKVLKEFAENINYGPEPDTISYLMKSGVTVKEVQVRMDDRTAGDSYLNTMRSVKYMFQMCCSIIFIQNFRKR